MKKKSLAIAILLLLALIAISRIETAHSYTVLDEELGEVEMT